MTTRIAEELISSMLDEAYLRLKDVDDMVRRIVGPGAAAKGYPKTVVRKKYLGLTEFISKRHRMDPGFGNTWSITFIPAGSKHSLSGADEISCVLFQDHPFKKIYWSSNEQIPIDISTLPQKLKDFVRWLPESTHHAV